MTLNKTTSVNQTAKIATFTNNPADQAHQLRWEFLKSDQAEEALSRWRELELRLGDHSVSSSATWTECWLNVFGTQIPHQFILMSRVEHGKSVLQGICLLTEGVGQKDGPMPIRTLHLGTAGEVPGSSACVEYNRILVNPQVRKEFVAGLWEHVQQQRKWEQFCIDGMSDEDLNSWKSLLPDASTRQRESRFCDLKRIRESETEVLSNLGSSTRSNLRRRLRSYGELETQWAESVDQAHEIFEELVELHQARWHAVGQPGAFHSQQFLEFQRQSSIKLFLENKAVLFRVRHQNETVGCLYLLNDRNRLLDYLSGFASFEMKPSPGLVSHYLCLTQALEHGYDAYDFLVGDKQHKNNLSTDIANLNWMVLRRQNWKSMALSGLRKIKTLLKSSRNQT